MAEVEVLDADPVVPEPVVIDATTIASGTVIDAIDVDDIIKSPTAALEGMPPLRKEASMKAYEQHDLGKLIPHMDHDDLERLRTSIEKDGYDARVGGAITLYEGRVLDGWHRYQICSKLGIEPVFEEYKGDNPRGFSIRVNVNRRHLNETQKAMVVRDMVTTKNGRPKKSATLPTFSQNDAAKLVGTSVRTLRTVSQICENERAAPALIQAMTQGTIQADPARALLKLPKEAQTKIAREKDERTRRKLIKEAKRKRKANPLPEDREKEKADRQIRAKRQKIGAEIVELGYEAWKAKHKDDRISHATFRSLQRAAAAL